MLKNERQAGAEVDSSTTADVTTSSHSIGNTNVSRSLVHPILFSTEMVKAILNDNKTQTRRILKNGLPIGAKWWQVYDGELLYRIVDSKAVHTLCKCPYGKVGDILWVKETYQKVSTFPEPDCFGQYLYKSMGDTPDKWLPSIFMPKKAVRLFLKITDITVERLQDISQEDILKEGVRVPVNNDKILWKLGEENNAMSFMPKGSFYLENPTPHTEEDVMFAHWAELWCSVNDLESWEENPYVWVITFERTDCPKGFC
jgi:hypothetical protein